MRKIPIACMSTHSINNLRSFAYFTHTRNCGALDVHFLRIDTLKRFKYNLQTLIEKKSLFRNIDIRTRSVI